VWVVREGAVLAQSGGRYVGPAMGIGLREGGCITTNRDGVVPHVIEG